MDQVTALPGRRQRLAQACQRAGLLPALSRMRGAICRDLRILAYHRVLDRPRLQGFQFDPELVSATAEEFEWQVGMIARTMQPVTFGDVVDHLEGRRRLPRRAVLVTFDDGYDDNYHVAFPILAAAGVPATFFVSTGHIDGGMPYAYDWLVHMVRNAPPGRVAVPALGQGIDVPSPLRARLVLARALLDRIKALPAAAQSLVVDQLAIALDMPPVPHPQCRPMTWDQLREMEAAGMEIGSHGMHHRMLAKLPREEMAAELEGSARRLAAELARPAPVLAYPVGGRDAFDDGVVSAARAAGFKLACTYVSGTSQANETSRFRLRRIPVERAVDRRWFEAVVALPEIFLHPTASARG